MDIWNKADKLNKEYISLNLDTEVIDYEKYKLYSIVTSSTQLEGSTLNEIDTQILLDEGLAAAGKPLEHHLMVKDNYEAIKYAIAMAKEKALLSPELLKKLNSLNMANTGQVVNSVRGTIDGRTGNFRLVSAFSEALGYYLDAPKIQDAVNDFCTEFNSKIQSNDSIELLKTSFDANAKLVIIHPWQDGNKRTSRLVMNFIQQRSNLPLTKIDKENAVEYITNLKIAKETRNLEPFRIFMVQQHIKNVQKEIDRYQQRNQ